jgi:hypothetical protein
MHGCDWARQKLSSGDEQGVTCDRVTFLGELVNYRFDRQVEPSLRLRSQEPGTLVAVENIGSTAAWSRKINKRVKKPSRIQNVTLPLRRHASRFRKTRSSWEMVDPVVELRK